MKNNKWVKILIILLILIFCPVIFIWIGAIYAIPYLLVMVGLFVYFTVHNANEKERKEELASKNVSRERAEAINNEEATNVVKSIAQISDEDEYYLYCFFWGQTRKLSTTSPVFGKEKLKSELTKKADKKYKGLFSAYFDAVIDYAAKNQTNIKLHDFSVNVIGLASEKKSKISSLAKSSYQDRVDGYDYFVIRYIKEEFKDECKNTYTHAIPKGER